MGSSTYPDAVPNTHGIPKALNDQVLIAPYNDLDAAASIICPPANPGARTKSGT